MIPFAEVSNEQAQKRYNVCLMCESYFAMTDMCKECWCVMSLKTKFKPNYGGKCPKGKWK